jgi:hypothetical protein
MASDGYRSYVIRVRRKGGAGSPIRLDVEDLIDGGRAALSGDAARTVADGLRTFVARANPDPGAAADAAPPEPRTPATAGDNEGDQ